MLTKTCEGAVEGHGAVSEALSTMRLRFGEPVRFRFLAGVLSSAGGHTDLLLAGLRFLNAFLRSAPGPQQRVYIQAELGQAGFQPDALRQTLAPSTAASGEVQCEFDAWQRQQVDVAALTQRCQQAESRATQLQDQLSQLQRRLQVLSLEQALKASAKEGKEGKDDDDSRSTPAEDEGISSSDQDRSLSPDAVDREPLVYEVVLKVPEDRPPIPRTAPRTAPRNNANNNMKQQRQEEQRLDAEDDDDEEETTIEEVMEEFQNIINDAETEVYANNNISNRPLSDVDQSKNVYVNSDTLTARIQVPYPQDNNILSSDGGSRTAAKSGRLRLEALFQNAPPTKPPPQQPPQPPQPTQRLQLPPRQAPSPPTDDDEHLQQHGESEIVPCALLPQPPRRAKSLVHLCAPSKDYVNLCNSSPFFDDADSFSNVSGDGDNSDSLLSASRETLGLGLGLVGAGGGASSDHASSTTRDKNIRNAADGGAGGGVSSATSRTSRTSRGYRSIAMIMPDEDCGDCNKDEDDVIKPVEVSVYQGMGVHGIPDILRCSKQAPRGVDPATVRNGSNYQPAGAAAALSKPTPSTATTASAASNGAPAKSPRRPADHDRAARTGSFDGLFYMADSPKAAKPGAAGGSRPVSGKPPAVAPKKKTSSHGGRSAAQTPSSASDRSDSQRSDGAARRAKSKSLERIDEGLNSMVDIVVSQKQQQRLSPEGVFQAREWSVEWGSRPAAGRLPLPANGGGPSPAGPVVIVSRSTSVRHQQRQFQPPRPAPGHAVGRRTPPEGANSAMFLPVSSRVSAFEKGDQRHHGPPMGPMGPMGMGAPSGPVSASFIIKRGHTNAGLYSGHHLIRDSHGPGGHGGHGPAMGPANGLGPAMAKIVNTAPVPGLAPGMPALTPGHDFTRGIHVNLALPSGKLTDLPSGLY
ncbi:hypothetical protein ONE63_007378 [Megalurothrips usitatus]|uniref:Formin FH3 domain-containing protein n=1 Tax=Megalurothrips usitatus TaxID=439358 RepID=A0AAV7XR40_9NEOP|nr:hypothetical protein ONE63_007378 [Megalurothrips usitatus]